MKEHGLPASGAELIHYAVHYGDEAAQRPDELFIALPETVALFESARVSARKLRSWQRDPLGMLTAFRDYLEDAEMQTASNVSRDPKRVLSTREVAIIVTRFFTYPAGADVHSVRGRAAPISQRQRMALELPDRDSPGFQRFDLTRPRASTGYYWSQFEGELRAFLERDGNAEQATAVELLPADTRALLRHGERYAEDLEAQLVGALAGRVSANELYVERALETQLLERVLHGSDSVLVLRGDAGFGKSSILWSLRRKLIQEELTPLLVSATWIAAGRADALLTVEQLVEHASRIKAAGLEPVVLLDTADLLLHTEGLIYRTAELLDQLEALSISTVLTVRPIEAGAIRHEARPFDLREYEGEELHRAVVVLMRQYFPSLQVERGFELVEEARTRGLSILAVLRSPLLLRMLFDTSGGEFPGLDYDVTALYERYWNHRVARDERGGRVTSERDLSPVAGRLGILMLADASPVLSASRIGTALARVDYPLPLIDAVSGMEALAQRGVLLEGDGTWRFAHQALFEFVAARALLARDGAQSASKLHAHVRSHPHDLFTGAVLEQLLILLARNEATRPFARSLVAELLSDPEVSLRQIGVVGWCHVPELRRTKAEQVDGATATRALRHLPQIRSIDVGQVLSLLRDIWTGDIAEAHRAFIDCLGLLIHRWPREIGEFVITEDVIGFMLTAFLDNYRQSDALVDLTIQLAHADPSEARRLSLVLIDTLPEVAGCLRTIHMVERHWQLLGGAEDYAAHLVQAATRSERRFRSHHRDFGIAAGDVLYASLRPTLDVQDQRIAHQNWDAFAAGVLARVGTTTPTITEAAQLHALARHLIATPAQQRDHVTQVLGHLFDREPDRGPLHVIGPFLMALITSDGIAREAVADALYKSLSRGLPARSNGARTAAQRWALTARAALIDPLTPEAFVADVVAGLLSDEPMLWRDPALLLSAVFPAALGGDPRAGALLADIRNDPLILARALDGTIAPHLSSPATIEFIERGLEYADRDIDAAEAVVLVAAATRRPGPIATLTGSDTGAAAIRRNRVTVRALISTMLTGVDRDQRDACTCWKRLQAGGLLTEKVADIALAFDKVRDPQGRASLIDMLPSATMHDLADAPAALALLRRHVLDDLRDPASASLSDTRRRLADAAFGAYRSILAISAAPDAWPPLWELVLQRPMLGSGTIDTDRFRDIATYFHGVLRESPGAIMDVTMHLIEASAWAQGHFSEKQAKTISNLLSQTARRVLQYGGEPARHLIEAVGELPPRLAANVLTTAVTTSGKRHIEDLLASGKLPPALASMAVERLRGHREAGFQPIPELIAGAPLSRPA